MNSLSAHSCGGTVPGWILFCLGTHSQSAKSIKPRILPKIDFPIVDVCVYFPNMIFILFTTWFQLASWIFFYCTRLQSCWALLGLKLMTKKNLPQRRLAIGSEQLEWNRELVKYLRKKSVSKALVWDGETLLISGLSLQWQKHLAVKVSAGWITEQFIKFTRLWWGHRGIDPERHEAEAGHRWNSSDEVQN